MIFNCPPPDGILINQADLYQFLGHLTKESNSYFNRLSNDCLKFVLTPYLWPPIADLIPTRLIGSITIDITRIESANEKLVPLFNILWHPGYRSFEPPAAADLDLSLLDDQPDQGLDMSLLDEVVYVNPMMNLGLNCYGCPPIIVTWTPESVADDRKLIVQYSLPNMWMTFAGNPLTVYDPELNNLLGKFNNDFYLKDGMSHSHAKFGKYWYVRHGTTDGKKDVHIGRLICVELTSGRVLETFNFVSTNLPIESSSKSDGVSPVNPIDSIGLTSSKSDGVSPVNPIDSIGLTSSKFDELLSPNKSPHQYPYECLSLAHDLTNIYLLVRAQDKFQILSLDQFGHQRWIKTLIFVHVIEQYIPHLEIKNDQLVIYGLNHDLYHNCNQDKEDGPLIPHRIDDKTGHHLMRTIDQNNEFVYSRVKLNPEDAKKLADLPIEPSNAWAPLITKDPYGRLYGNDSTIKGKINFFG